MIILKKNFSKKDLVLTLSLIFCIFFITFICTFNSFDQSIFYFESENQSITFFKFVAASVASLLFYLIGSMIYFFLFVCFYFIFFIFKKRTVKNELDRITSIFLMFISFSLLVEYYFKAGGLSGRFFFKKMLNMFGNDLLDFIILSSFVFSVLLFSRFSIFFIIFRVSKLSFIKAILEKINLILSPIKKTYVQIYHFFTKSNEEIKDSLFDIEYATLLLSDERSIEKDSFWQEYLSIKDHAPNVNQDIKIELTPLKLPNIKEIFINEINNADLKKIDKENELQAKVLLEKLKCFGIYGKITSIIKGPVITLFEYEPQIDTKISKIIALEDDLAMALETTSIRILAPIPGKSLIGFEIANKQRQNVYFSDIINSIGFNNLDSQLPLILGEDTIGKKSIIDLAKMPHILVAGSTGSGKSICLNAMLISLLCRKNSQDLKLILIDPKRLEFNAYQDISHLLFPIINCAKQAAMILKWLTKEMENRYQIMASVFAKNILDFNRNSSNNYNKLPYIVVVIDEFADLMMTGNKEIEDSIIRIAQMARACGIHIILATQRPSVDVITGLIKVNFPSRIAFKVASKIDSRTILDESGAQKLLGKGDMLFLNSNSSNLTRIHGAYITDVEIEKVVKQIKNHSNVQYLNLDEINAKVTSISNDEQDELYPNVIDYLNEIEEISISLLQRKFRIGYNRSARIIELLESQGFIMPAQGVKPRKIIKPQK